MKSKAPSALCAVGFKTTKKEEEMVCRSDTYDMTTYKSIIPFKFNPTVKSTKPFKGVEARHHLIDFIPPISGFFEKLVDTYLSGG